MQRSTVDPAAEHLTPTSEDPARSWSDASASRSPEPDELVEEPDSELERDAEALSDDSDDDDDDAPQPRPPQIVFSTASTMDRSTARGPTGASSPPEAPAVVAGGPQVSVTAAAVTSERERARRRLARSRERRATLVLGVVMASFVGCWLPFFVVYPLSLLVGFDVPPLSFAVIFWLGYCNSALNPVIYTAFNRDFRAAFQRMLCPRRPALAKRPTRF